MLAQVEEQIRTRTQGVFFAVNPIKIVLARVNYRLAQTAYKARVCFADGIGVVWAMNLLHRIKIERIPGYEFMLDVLALGNRKKYTAYLIGSKKEVISKTVNKLNQRYPNLKIGGFRDGFFQNEDERHASIEEIQHSKPDIVFVAMGAIIQDDYIKLLTEESDIPFIMGVGGSFDVIAGAAPRAPHWLLSHGLEWLYRLIRQPKRIKPMAKLPMFVCLVLKEKINRISH
ncbi:MAG: WecB/TagA/CpsF family glycosyltransferase [Deferribacteres bacterium]|nr:WecB/TagA/CpsF family glycosyltransferase [candidate division KSB1 bacterium]MCB9501330.1 WecB/TagA/CpsF family glycosyltransferase [Deferribacteres bacterium]